jgi:hypothetical protein
VEEAIAEGRRAVATAEVAVAEDLKVEAIVEADLAARHREAAIEAEVVLPAAEEARHRQAAVLPQGTTVVDLLGAGWRPAFPPHSPSGGFARSLLLSWMVSEKDENFFMAGII